MAPVPLKPLQRDALLELLRVVAQGELQAEQLRMRLGECHDFEPYEVFQNLQGGWRNQSGWLTSYGLHRWLADQPHSLACARLEDVAAMLTPYEGQRGELRYDGFLKMVLPKDSSHVWLKDAVLARGSRDAWSSGTRDERISPEVAYRLCQLFENEIDVGRHLQFHRKILMDLGTAHPNICKFLDSKQGVCAGMGGLISPGSVRNAVVEESQALSTTQCNALLQRINPSGACLVAFSEVAKALSLGPSWPITGAWDGHNDSLEPTGSFYETVGFNSSLALSPMSPLVGHQESSLLSPRRVTCNDEANSLLKDSSSLVSPRRVTWSDGAKSPVKDALGRDQLSRSFDIASRWASPRMNVDTSKGSPRQLAPRGLRSRLDLSPASPGQKSFGVASTQASTADYRSPRSPAANALSPFRPWVAHATPPRATSVSSPPRRPWSALVTPTGESCRQARASSLPASARATSARASSPRDRPNFLDNPWSRPFFSMDTSTWNQPRKDLQPPYEPVDQNSRLWMVLKAMVQQAELDAHVEDAKALIPVETPLEAIFDALDRFRKGYITDTDLWAFGQQFGGQPSFAHLGALVHEVQRRRPRDFSVVDGRLSFRELGSLVLKAGTEVREAVDNAATDDEARSMVYLLRNSEPCPNCGIRIQRDADSAGCPSVTCTVCGTSFRCFAVLGDLPRYIPPLSASVQYHLYRLFEVAGSAAADLERARRELSLLPGRDLYCTLSSVFTHVAGGPLSMSMQDLRCALTGRYVAISEQELALLRDRYSRRGSSDVTFADFVRQLTPRTTGGSL